VLPTTDGRAIHCGARTIPFPNQSNKRQTSKSTAKVVGAGAADNAVRCASLYAVLHRVMSMSTTARKPSISIRLDARTIAHLEREAQSERRPISSLVRNLLDDALAQRQRDQAARGNNG
jgi:hypothetical protein